MKRIVLMLSILALVLLGGTSLAEDFTWDEATAQHITLGDGDVLIDKAGTYVLTGTLEDGQVRIEATKDDTVRLVLAGVNITSSTSAPIYAAKTDELIVILADGTENFLTDASEYVYAEGEDEPDAALFAKDDLTIGGSGNLTVTANYRNGIGTKDDLVIAGGIYYIQAANDGLRGKDSVTIEGGDITIVAANDGIKSNNATDADKGMVTISGGTLSITAAGDGIQADNAMTITGGDFTIVTGGGAANAPERTSSGDWGRWQGQATEATTTEDSTSMKGLKAENSLTIDGGTFNIDAADDSLHTNGDMTINGGTLTLSTGDDGAHADGALAVTGGSITITQSYEGLEGATVAISGGDIHLVASDDGINAAGGSDGNQGPWGMDSFRGGSSSYWIEITGGNIWIDAQGDGLDSNGKLTVSGGNVVIHGTTGSGDSPLDADGGIEVNGGTVIAAGSAGMVELPGSGSAQPSLMLYYNSTKQAGTTVTLQDASGTVLATYTAEKNMQTILFSTPEMTDGGTYTIVTDGTAVTATLSGAMTSIGEDGAAVSGGRGGFGGGGFGGGMPGGGGGGGRMPGGNRQEGQQPAAPDQMETPPDMPSGITEEGPNWG